MPVNKTDRRPIRQLVLTRRLASLALGLMLVGCASMSGEIEQESREDAVLATRIKAELLGVPELGAAAITVESDRGNVTLSGFVGTQEQRREAERLTNGVDGVGQIVNELEVKN